MGLPIVAVVGRPNVGKSTLVNRIARIDDAIVHEMRGVTRDRSYHKADWAGRSFVLVDTGGIEANDNDVFQAPIRQQALFAADEADAIIFLVDGRTGVTSDDEAIAKILQLSEPRVFLAVNKMDNPSDDSMMWEFYSMGLGDPWPLSATHGHGTGDLLDAVVAVLPPAEEEEDPDTVDVAIIGRPNAGKSSLTNRLLGRERTIVSEVAGTTRDSIDTMVEHGGKHYRLVDTAGIRRKAAQSSDVEYYGYVRALRAVGRADVALLTVDASVGVTEQDQRVASIALEHGCAIVVLLNKWDLLETDRQRADITDAVKEKLGFISFAPVLRISALTGRSVDKVWEFIDRVYASYSFRVSTGKLNDFLTQLRDFGHTVVKGGKRLKIRYGTQNKTQPPQFTFFANYPELADNNFSRYLENRLREVFGFEGTPIKIHVKKKG